jgi:DNA-binding protein H-NS
MAKSTGIDLSKLSLEELQNLARDIETEIVTRRAAEKERVLNQMRELAAGLGMTLEEVLREERLGGSVAAPRYRHPDEPTLTWSGRGKRPAWVTEALASGKSLEDLAIT